MRWTTFNSVIRLLWIWVVQPIGAYAIGHTSEALHLWTRDFVFLMVAWIIFIQVVSQILRGVNMIIEIHERVGHEHATF